MRRTERDNLLLQTLGNFGVLSTAQLGNLFFPRVKRTTVLRRLRKLRLAGYMRQILNSESKEIVWAISNRGAQSVGLTRWIGSVNKNSLMHDLLFADIRISLGRSKIGDSWVSEWEMKKELGRSFAHNSMIKPIIPDAAFSVDVGSAVKTYALELELSAKTRKRYEEIFYRYRVAGFSGVLYLVSSPKMGEMLADIWQGRGNRIPFGWTLHDEVLTDPSTARVRCADEVYLLNDWLKG